MKAEQLETRPSRSAIGVGLLRIRSINIPRGPKFKPQSFLLTPGGEDYVGINSYDQDADCIMRFPRTHGGYSFMEVERTEVEKLAYHLWQERGRPIGSPDEDWFRAEAKLRQQNSKYELPLFALAMEAREESWR